MSKRSPSNHDRVKEPKVKKFMIKLKSDESVKEPKVKINLHDVLNKPKTSKQILMPKSP